MAVTHLAEVKLIDIRKSTIDEKRSDPKKGIYKFTNEVVADRGITRNPNWKHKWASKGAIKRYSQDWESSYDAEYVGINPNIFPKGAKIDENGHWAYRDAVLMRIPLDIWADKVKRDRDLDEAQAEAVIKKYQREMGKEALSPEEVDRVLGI